ncbi:MAG: phosphoribosylanthranilate isomerase [Proteobacteria bacterium]|nr:phosphoribosylanthranilate isomerase [Pseudomonadota bacterium]
MPVHIKVCGITRPEDAQALIDAGADAIGLMFAPSPRQIDSGLARELAELTQSLSRVAVFVDADPAQIESVLHDVPIDVLQFHGDEPREVCNRWGLPYWKAMRVREEFDMGKFESAYPDAQALLFDSFTPGVSGGSGEAFNWTFWPRSKRRLVLAGGLGPHNVAQAIQMTRPWAVDVSSGVESSKGIKDHRLIHDFVREAKNAG